MKRYLVGLIKMYGDKPSLFSKKRVESGLSFLIGQVGMLVYLFTNYDTIDINTILLWASLEFTISGYMVNLIQKEKISNKR